MVCLLYIITKHRTILWCRALPALSTFLQEHMWWPQPLRRRSTRRRFFQQLRHALWTIADLVLVSLLISNSLTQPSIVADKWYATPTTQPLPQARPPTHSNVFSEAWQSLKPMLMSTPIIQTTVTHSCASVFSIVTFWNNFIR